MLQEENSALQYEIDNLNKVASYVGSRVAKVLVGARRANNYNSSLVAELKRWNRKLEVRCPLAAWKIFDLRLQRVFPRGH